MNFKSPQFWLAVIATSVVIGYAGATLTRSSPGSVSASHAALDSLTGPLSCGSCHGGWFGDMTSACSSCHDEIAEQLESKQGLHGVQHPELAARCQTCHSEHHGAAFPIVNAQSFAMAGVPDVEAFDHGLVGYEMSGRHLELGCAECHQNADAPSLAEDEHRYLGLSKDCSSCHDDAHDGKMQVGCAQCHTQTDWNQLHAPSHDRVLPLEGGHGALDCSECHKEDSDLDLDVIGGRFRRAYKQNCLQCHHSPHKEEVIAAVGAAEKRSPESSCELCHEADHESFDDERLTRTVTSARHAHTGFRLDEPHADQSCDACHGNAQHGDVRFSADTSFAERHPGRSPTDCNACHDDVHNGEFDDSPLAPEGCTDCHATTHFAPHAFTVAMHEETSFALTHSHRETDCHACHEAVGDNTIPIFSQAPARCDGCHSDAHDGYFAPFTEELENATQTGSCSHCHEPTSFDDVPQERFDHGHFTGLAVEGAHLQAGCESCHPRSELEDRHGREFGRVSDHINGSYAGCVSCHTDPHGGAFDHPNHPPKVDGRAGCARCHQAVSFRALVDEFDHHAWTDFELRGGHRAIDCTSCHQPLVTADPHSGRTTAPAAGRKCIDCHTDPHGGQFLKRRRGESAATNDCSRCHRDGESFDDLLFNHNVHARFRLGAQHADVECDRCHGTFEHEGQQLVRYRPIPRRCSDCHGSARSPFRRRRSSSSGR